MADLTFPGVERRIMERYAPYEAGAIGLISAVGSDLEVVQNTTLANDYVVDLARFPALCQCLDWELYFGTNVSAGSPLCKIELWGPDDTVLGTFGTSIPLSDANGIRIFKASADAHLAKSTQVNGTGIEDWRKVSSGPDVGKGIHKVVLTVTANGTWQAGKLGFVAEVRRRTENASSYSQPTITVS